MDGQSQRVVMIHDASSGVRINSVKWVLDGFKLKPGDVFTFLSVLHQIHHPMGYKIRVDGSMFGGANQKAIDDELARKRKELDRNNELVEISKLYETQNIDFKIELVAGPIPKNAALEASKKSNATWVILDRRMKRDKKYFMEKLSCGISTMKRNDNIVKIRGPKPSSIQNPTTRLSYGEMLPVDNKISPRETTKDEDLFSIEFDSSCTSSTSTRTSFSDKINQLSTLLESLGEEQENSQIIDQVQTPPDEKDLKRCTTCKITRPTSVWESRKFSYLELVDATNRFSSENLIYRGENVAVFHGSLKDKKLNAAVKEQKDLKKYKSEIQALENTRNENVIMLLGTCSEKNTKLLVFEYACNGSLDQHLSHQSSRPLTWAERINIAIGASRGLYHLHENHIIHGDVRPKNILLTHDFDALIAGFGLAKTKNEPENTSDHFIIGTFGYLAPEYTQRGKSSTKTDVYAFGVVLLELLTGRSPTDTRLKGQTLLKWAVLLVKDKRYSELVDPGTVYDDEQFKNMVHVALNCLCKDPRLRLSMDEVVFTLEYIKDERRNSHERSNSSEDVETVGQSQHILDERVNYDFGGMTPLPKQAKHFYQMGRV